MISFITTVAAHPIIVLFLLANLAIGFWAHTKAKANSFEDYALASRSLPTGVLVMTLLGTQLGGGDLGESTHIFNYGLVQILGTVTVIISFLLMGTFVAPFLVYFSECMTTGDLMGKLYGRTAKIVTGILGCAFCALVISAQIEGIGSISHELLGIPFKHAILFFGLPVIFYSVWGGMRSVSYTDVLQVIASLIILGYIAQIVLREVGGLAFFSKLPKEKIAFFNHSKFFYKIKSAVVWRLYPTFLLTPPIVQRMLMTQNKRQVRQMWYAGLLLYIFILSFLLLIGLGALSRVDRFRLHGNPKNVLLRVINTLFEKNSLSRYLIFVGLMGILLSTIDSYLHALGISLVQDIIGPLREIFLRNNLDTTKKKNYARIGMSLSGVIAIFIGAFGGTTLLNSPNYKIALVVISIIMIPLLIGIMGVKTDNFSLMSFTVAYIISMCRMGWEGWYVREKFYNNFLLGVTLGTIAYFITHIYRNSGIVILKRSEQTIAEQLWLPTWQGTVTYFKSWLLSPLQLHILAGRKIVNSPTQSLPFSMLIFALYTFSSVMTGGKADMGLANFMAGVHVIGITLCCGLMLEGIWPDKLKPYFALYWFATLFYCLPLGGTLAFLRAHEGAVNGTLWVGSFMLLAILVDSTSFLLLSTLGASIAFGGWYMVIGSLSNSLWSSDASLMAILLLFILIMGIVIFGKNREQHSSQRLNWNRTASSILGHDLRNTANMLSGVANVINSTFKMSEPAANTEGKQGYWIEKQHGKFLEDYAQKLTQKSTDTKREIKNFMDFMEQQVIGWLEQEKMSMHKTVKDVVASMKHKYASSMQITISCPKDFEANVFSVFPNVIANLIKNASLHGQATKVTVKVDGVKRTLTVRDNGKGISADVLPHIFDLNFTTGDKGKKNAGVGLAFVKMVMNASSGKISCHSRKGDEKSFTEFAMEFPEA